MPTRRRHAKHHHKKSSRSRHSRRTRRRSGGDKIFGIRFGKNKDFWNKVETIKKNNYNGCLKTQNDVDIYRQKLSACNDPTNYKYKKYKKSHKEDCKILNEIKFNQDLCNAQLGFNKNGDGFAVNPIHNE
jgi:hypothetical protein